MAPVKYPGKLGVRPSYNSSQEWFDGVCASLGHLNDADRQRIIEHLGSRTPRQKRFEHQLEGIALLFQHYKIAGTDPLLMHIELVLALARDHVPYFMPPTRIGAPKTLQWAFVGLENALRNQTGQRRDEIFHAFAELTSSQVETLKREFNRWKRKRGENCAALNT